jgi:hypothetical protein
LEQSIEQPFSFPRIRSYEKAVASFKPQSNYGELEITYVYPTVVPNWDNSPRSGRKSLILHGSTPQKYGRALKKMFAMLSTEQANGSNRILFIKSWNEWAEGNYLEPDLKYGSSYLQKTKSILNIYRSIY